MLRAIKSSSNKEIIINVVLIEIDILEASAKLEEVGDDQEVVGDEQEVSRTEHLKWNTAHHY